MRKVLLSTFSLFLCSLTLMAQYQKPNMSNISKIAMPKNDVAMTGFEASVRPDVPMATNSLVSDRTDIESLIGTTIYDLQTNGAVQNRLVRNESNGNLAATWIRGFGVNDGYADRGAGYNTSVDGAWASDPTARVESVRTGWPSLTILEDGSHVIVAHLGTNQLNVARNASGSWVESTIPSNAAPGLLWPRSVSGDGTTVHVVAITTPVANGGAIYEGVDAHLLYHRSLDGGSTWDMVDVILPDFDNTRFTRMNADSYAIDADGETVAIALFSGFGDVLVAKSTNNGTDWTTHIVKDFPFDPYTTDMGYDTTLLDPQETLDGPNGTAIQTSDGTGDVLVDESGMVHVVYGEMYVQDIDLTDGNTSFFPGTSGVRYWNEGHGPDSTRTIAGLVDGDGNGVFDLASANNIANYGTSLTSFPTMGVDENNNIFVAFSGMTDNFINDNASPNAQNNRHIFATASLDNGETWMDEPVDVIREDIVLEVDLLPAIEAVFPTMARNVGSSQVALIYQQDFEPGLAIRGDLDPTSTNFISFIGITLDEFGIISGTDELVNADVFNFDLAPNPATEMVKVSYELPEASKVTLTINNMMGQTVRVIENSNHSAGTFTANVNINDLANGVYLVTFRANDRLAVQKLIVE